MLNNKDLKDTSQIAENNINFAAPSEVIVCFHNSKLLSLGVLVAKRKNSSTIMPITLIGFTFTFEFEWKLSSGT